MESGFQTTNLVLFSAGFILNGLTIVTLLFNKRLHKLSSVDLAATALVVVCTFWSGFETIGYPLTHTTSIPFSYPLYVVMQALDTALYISLYGVNVTLALERYLFTKRTSPVQRRNLIKIQWMFFGFLIGITFIAFVLGRDSVVLMPTKSPMRQIWLSAVGTAFSVTVVSTITFHALAFQISLRELRSVVAQNEHLKAAGVRLERRMLLRTGLMNLLLLTCQIPTITLRATAQSLSLDPVGRVQNTFNRVGITFSAVETIVTPIVVLYFFPTIRQRCFNVYGHNECAQSNMDSEERLEQAHDEGEQTDAASDNLQISNKHHFGIVRIVEGSLAQE
ncbi:hypothetical protein BC830DRAFT_1098193 [Chytriomyces sp. MP71]|nr:hypothetical protein BC830DRAFT_1098193 [Chytriomyces sp. MP71]